MVDNYILSLVEYAVKCGLIEAEDRCYAVNALLSVMQMDGIADNAQCAEAALPEVLEKLTDDAVTRGECWQSGSAGLHPCQTISVR